MRNRSSPEILRELRGRLGNMYNLDEILIQSVKVKASDIHLTTGRPPSYRIDGVLTPIEGERLTPQMLEDILMPLMDVRHREELQNNGQTDFAYAISGVGRFRVNVFKQRGTLASVMRSLPFNIPEPEELGIPAEVVEMTTRKRGLILVTGPTGSGKSTTLASLIHVINRTYPYHIITLEDPIEYLHRHDKSIVNQRDRKRLNKLCAGVKGCTSRGSGCYPGRRDARSGNDFYCDHCGGDRTFGIFYFAYDWSR